MTSTHPRFRSIVTSCLVALACLEGSAAAQVAPGIPRSVARPMSGVLRAPTAKPLPMWTGSFTAGAVNYSYRMVGTDPALGSHTTRVKVHIIPVRFDFVDGLGGSLSALDPMCGDTKNAVVRTKTSPVFKSVPYTLGGTSIGRTQYIDAFQRANFWNLVSTVAPNYHVKLSARVRKLQTVAVPTGLGSTDVGVCANYGVVDIDFFDGIAQSLISSLEIPQHELPLFLFYNTFLSDSGGCCILGYHSALGLGDGVHTYAISSYSDAGLFGAEPIQDISVLTHELGEWLDDPWVDNATPAWGNVGQVIGSCQADLEVGDPVTGTGFPVTVGKQTYWPEDLVFKSWFAREVPSQAVNGWYSFLNAFASPAAACP